ncbi:MAG: DUF2784 domain-containing protein [Pseudomonadota bacterium]
MNAFSRPVSALLADFVLIIHVGVVAFVVLGQLLFVMGGFKDWTWVRRIWIRLMHLALMAFVLVQSWVGMTCPLTIWEQTLRRQAGQSAYAESFIGHWLSQLIFFNAPPWVFVVAYTLFGALVVLTWWRIPPRKSKRP